jgi:hypothetical protein
VVKTEAHTLLLSIYLNARVTSFCRCHKGLGMKKVVTEVCRKIRYRLNYRLLQVRLIAEKKQSR